MMVRWSSSVLLLSLSALACASALQASPEVSLRESDSLSSPSLSTSPRSTSSESDSRAIAAAFPKSTTLFSTHPAIAYHPSTDCIHRILWLCTGRSYAWSSHDYVYNAAGLDSADSNNLNRSFAVVTNEHNNDYGNGVREVIIRAPRAKEIKIYGVPPARAHGHDMAAQELCFDSAYFLHQQRQMIEAQATHCIPLDVQHAYREAHNDWEPVLLWSGKGSTSESESESGIDLETTAVRDGLSTSRGTGRDTVIITLRMTGRAHRKGEVTKWMTLDSVVCTSLIGSDNEGARKIRTPPFGSLLSQGTIDSRSWWRVGYTPQKRWATSTNGRFMQASTVYDHFKNASIPRVAFSFKGSDVKIWMAPRSQLELPPGGVELCFDSTCELVDVHQLYLNLPTLAPTRHQITSPEVSIHKTTSAARSPDNPEDQPVLFWSTDGLDYRSRHYVQISLIEPNPELYEDYEKYLKGITFHHVEYTRVFHKNSDRYWLALEDFIAEQLFISIILFALLAYGAIMASTYILYALLILLSVCASAFIGCIVCARRGFRRKASRRDPHVFSPVGRRMHRPLTADERRRTTTTPSERTPLYGTPPSTYFDAFAQTVTQDQIDSPPAPSNDWTSQFAPTESSESGESSSSPPPYPHPPSYEAIAPSWSRVAPGSEPRAGSGPSSASLRSSRPLPRMRTDALLRSSPPTPVFQSEPPAGLRRSLPPPYSVEDTTENEQDRE